MQILTMGVPTSFSWDLASETLLLVLRSGSILAFQLLGAVYRDAITLCLLDQKDGRVSRLRIERVHYFDF